MAKGSGNRGSGSSSRIRFIMLDADLNDGDLSQFTQAIANAIRPGSGQRAIAALPRAAHTNAEAPASSADEVENAIEVVDEVTPVSTGSEKASNASARPRTYKAPQVIDVDLMAGDVSFPDYAKAKNPPDEATKKYLVVAAWFKEYGGVSAITIDHVYTAFRRVKWPTNIPDFDLPFRKLIKSNWVKRMATGQYEINHLGLAELENMGQAPSPSPGADATA